MKKLFMLVAMLGLMTSVAACGGDDEEETKVVNEEYTAPQVVSITPADGTLNLESGNIECVVTYDQNIIFNQPDYAKITLTAGSITGAVAKDKSLIISTVIGPDASVTVTIPAGLVKSTHYKEAPEVKFTFTTQPQNTPGPTVDDGHESAAQAVKNMGPGWNLGNTLDSYGSWIGDHQPTDKYETAWLQPVTDAHLMKAFKEKGFGAIRVPVTWFQHMQADGTVDADWMDRVQQVVDYVLDAGMYCILNVHHDTGAHDDAWVVADWDAYNGNNGQGKNRYEMLWSQIATRFKDYDEKLLFEGYNEMLDAAHTWNAPKNVSDVGVVNLWAESFVSAVRAVGGNNAYRNLIVTTYAAAHGGTWGNTMNVLSDFRVPTDPCGNQNHLIVEVHSYDPYDWVNTYKMTWTQACHNELVTMFKNLQTYFINQGYPVIIGEYGSNGANEVTINASSTAEQKAEAGRQGADMTRLCKQNGAAAFYWMGLVDGKDRAEATFKWTMEQVADSIVNAYRQ